MEEDRPRTPPHVGHLVFGAMLIVAGIILFVKGLSIFFVFGLWPLVIVGIGVNMLATACCMRRVRSGVMTTVIGLWLSLNQFTAVRYRDSWPLLLVAVGGIIVWGAVAPARPCAACEGRHDN